jgi:L-2,4-diaminobutyric acid acetyltransferase
MCKPLGVHTGYTYWVMFHHFNESCFVIQDGGNIIGYVSGMKSQSHSDVFFLWQIGVAEEARGKGYSYLLLEKIFEAAKRMNCKKMQFSLEDLDGASFKSFSGFARKHNREMISVGKAKYPHSVRESWEEDTLFEIPI